MALTSSTELDAAARLGLLAAAHGAIRDGLAGPEPAPPVLDGHPPVLRAPAATFVTLNRDGALRGCIGTLEACQPLLVDAARNAYAAAFHDPRFPPLARAELEDLQISISILTAPERLNVASEEELLRRLRPGIDGLILGEGERRGTFLPVVWQSIGDARAFLAELKHKAGLPPDYWSDTIEVLRYTTISVP